jgi:hypothetical protein
LPSAARVFAAIFQFSLPRWRCRPPPSHARHCCYADISSPSPPRRRHCRRHAATLFRFRDDCWLIFTLEPFIISLTSFSPLSICHY